MFQNEYSSVLLQKAVEEIASLPGIGRKSALRMALHLLHEPEANVRRFSEAILDFRTNIRFCPLCCMISDDENCPYCANPKRDHSIVCVVESHRDVLSIENTGQYHGLYHVLGGIISPMDGIGPSDLSISKLAERVAQGDIKEVIMALSTSIEGETTSFYIYRRLEKYPVTISTIARGVGFGDDLEYTDELTLGRSITARQLFIPNR
ncbi:MAG: recombination protein RecR [Bacteroidales bacterium]|nr:recombination protein RecR [Bacteroidales bacterium]